MGGYGSGRRGGRDVTTDYRQLDVRRLHRAGVLKPGHVGTWNWYRGEELRASIIIDAGDALLTLRYSATSNGERRNYAYPVPLSWSACTYGGARPWFRCPRCQDRVAVLYGGAEFVCRHCRRLAYQVQRETANDRIIRRADAIRERLGWGAGILNGGGWKPKGMHWKTYHRLTAEYYRLAEIGLEGLSRQLSPVRARLDGVERRLRR